MNLFRNFLNYFRPAPKTAEDLRDLVQAAVDNSAAQIQDADLESDEIKLLERLALMNATQEEFQAFIGKLGNRVLKKPCTDFDRVIYDFLPDLAGLGFEDFMKVSNCIDAARSHLMTLTQDKMNTMIQTAMVQYITSPEGKKASNDIILSKAVIIPQTVGDA